MKKFLFLALCSALLGFAACDSENDITTDQLGFYPLEAGPVIIYADQTSDTVSIISTRDWTAETRVDWFSIRYSNDDGKLTGKGSPNMQTLRLAFDTNPSDTARYSFLFMNDGHRGVSRMYLQTYWLHVVRPGVTFVDKSGQPLASLPSVDDLLLNPDVLSGARFNLQTSKDSISDYLQFTIHANAAQLSTQADWIAPEETAFSQGEHTVKLNFSKNTSTQARTADFLLRTSNGLESTITVVQPAQ